MTPLRPRHVVGLLAVALIVTALVPAAVVGTAPGAAHPAAQSDHDPGATPSGTADADEADGGMLPLGIVLGPVVVLVGVGIYLRGYSIAWWSEQIDVVGSTTPESAVEPADWRVKQTRWSGLLVLLVGVGWLLNGLASFAGLSARGLVFGPLLAVAGFHTYVYAYEVARVSEQQDAIGRTTPTGDVEPSIEKVRFTRGVAAIVGVSGAGWFLFALVTTLV